MANVNEPVALGPASAACPCESDGARVSERYGALLTDESRLSPSAPAALYLPRSHDEVSAAVAECAARGLPLVVSGGRTGIVGGAVAREGAALLSLQGLKADVVIRRDESTGEWTAIASAGTTLEELRQRLRGDPGAGGAGGPGGPGRLFYPVDPTETSASLGGTVATNASGARTLLYGPTRSWVRAVTAVLADGRRLRVARGESRAAGGLLRLAREGATALEVATPAVPAPQTKHTAGYHLGPEMDLLDLLIGGEGTLAIVTGVELRLAETPAETVGMCVFAPGERGAEELVALIRAETALTPSALESMDGASLELLRAFRASAGEASGVPPIPERARSMLYVEASFADDGALDGFVGSFEGVLSAAGISMDDVWAGFEPRELEAMKAFRHALPERINALISERKRALPDLTKIGTDLAVPVPALAEMMGIYREALAAEGLEHYTFGHIGNGHVHVNIAPRSADEMRRARRLYGELARRAVALGGSVAGEHGIGRLKRELMRIQYDEGSIEAMRRVKAAWDPQGLLNPGVMLPD